MTTPASRGSGQFRYLTRADVIAAAKQVPHVEIVHRALVLHAQGQTSLPAEAYLPWQARGGPARSLALPGALWGPDPAIGVKLINSSLGNVSRGLPRAQGFTTVFDPETAYPAALMEAGYLSALRTSAYTVLSARYLAPPSISRIAVVGCGVIGEMHVQLLAAEYPSTAFALFDQNLARRDELQRRLSHEDLRCVAADSAAQAVAGAGIVVTATTTTSSYLPYSWLYPGALIAHVSLDDVEPEVVRRAELVVVDDWELVSSDHRRLLGRMFRAGQIAGPKGECAAGASAEARQVDGTLAGVLNGEGPSRRTAEGIVLSNPFGMGILDVALAAAVGRVAERQGLGVMLDF